MKSSKFNLSIITALTLGSALLPVQAQWSQTSGTGPYIYTDPANWYGGVVSNLFTNAIQSGTIITFTNDYILSGGVTIGFLGSSNVTFQSDSATPRTLHISLGQILRTNATGGTITIGTTNNPLVLDLYNSTRTIGGSTPFTTSFGNICTMNVYAQIVDPAGGTNGVVCGGGNTYCYLFNTNNSFLGPVSFASLRGGGFANIKPIGGGPSSLGAPLDATNGTITVTDGSSSGTLKYLGTGDTTDRPFNWVVTAYHANMSWTGDYQFLNAGSGLLKLSGPWTFPTNRSANSELVINASTAPIEFDGYISGTGNANGTSTSLLLAGGPASIATNRITLTCATNDFRDFMISNVVVAYNSVAPAGAPCSLGAGTNIILGGGSGGAGWAGNTGQGSSLQYYGPNGTFTRNITFNGGTSSYNWALDNAGTNTALTWSNNLAWNMPGLVIGFNARYLFINPNISATNIVLSYIPDANIVVGGQPIGITVAAANPVGITVNNGGVVQLLNPTNTFAGGVQAAYARTIQAMTLADIGQPSSIGTALNPYTVGTPAVQLNGINLGSTDSQRGGILSYIGTNNASSNQKITILGNATGSLNSGTIRNDSPNNSSLHLTDTGGWTLYSSMPFCLATLGGSAHVTNTLDSYMQDVNGAPGTGSLLVNGSAWRLTAIQTYSGTTMVANATLVLNGTVAAGLGLTVGAGGVLAGTGTVNEDTTVLANGTVTAGDGAIGTLAINGNLTNSGSIAMKLNKAADTNDQIVGVNTLVYGGTLVVTNLAGTLASGDSFPLFAAATYQGAFSSISPATPGSGLAWDLTSLTNNGALKVMVGASNPPHIGGIQASGSSVILSGTGGTASATYYVVSSTNVALPLTNWTRLATNAFDADGNFNITNVMSGPQEFFRLELP